MTEQRKLIKRLKYRTSINTLNKNQFSFNSDLNNQSIKNHPIIIFYDDYNQEVYYLTMKSYRPKHDYLINDKVYYFLSKDLNNPHLYTNKDSIIDTSTIYKMNYTDFVNNFHIDPSNIENEFRILNISQQKQIIDYLINNVNTQNICIKQMNANNQLELTKPVYTTKKWIKYQLYLKYSDPNLLNQEYSFVDNNNLYVSINKYMNNTSIKKFSQTLMYETVINILNDWKQENEQYTYDKNSQFYIDVNYYENLWLNKNKDKEEY